MTMDQAEQLSELISHIYDAALDSSLWIDVVGRAGRFVGGSAAAIFAKSPTAGSGHVYYEYGTDPHYRQLYFEKYVKLDPSTTGHYFADVEHPIAVADLCPTASSWRPVFTGSGRGHKAWWISYRLYSINR
jgi:hypothetical protein